MYPAIFPGLAIRSIRSFVPKSFFFRSKFITERNEIFFSTKNGTERERKFRSFRSVSFVRSSFCKGENTQRNC